MFAGKLQSIEASVHSLIDCSTGFLHRHKGLYLLPQTLTTEYLAVKEVQDTAVE